MKRMKAKVNLLLMALAVLFVTSCGSSPEEKVKGKWLLSDIKITNADGSDFDGNQEAADNLIKGILDEKKTFEFMDDEKFTVTVNGETKNGTYKAVDLDGKISIALFSEDMSDVTKIELDEITDKEMISSFEEKGTKFTYTYTKQ